MEFIGTETLPSVINDPFLKDSLYEIDIHYTQKLFTVGEGYWWANVSFKNGNTRGNQKTGDYATFDEVIIALKQIFNSVK